MLLTIKKTLNWIDVFFSKTCNFVFEFILGILFIVLCITAALFVLCLPFEGDFKVSNLDPLETYTIIAFFLITVRFFKRSKLEGISAWESIISYYLITAACIVFFILLAFSVLGLELYNEKQIQLKDIFLNMDLIYFSFSGLFIVALYMMAPLPSGKENVDDESVEPLSEQADFFTDSEGNSRNNFVDIDSVDLKDVNLTEVDLDAVKASSDPSNSVNPNC